MLWEAGRGLAGLTHPCLLWDQHFQKASSSQMLHSLNYRIALMSG